MVDRLDLGRTMRVRFLEWTFDAESRQLIGGAGPVHISPKAFDLLAALLLRPPPCPFQGRAQGPALARHRSGRHQPARPRQRGAAGPRRRRAAAALGGPSSATATPSAGKPCARRAAAARTTSPSVFSTIAARWRSGPESTSWDAAVKRPSSSTRTRSRDTTRASRSMTTEPCSRTWAARTERRSEVGGSHGQKRSTTATT